MSKTINAPMKFVFNWCVDYRSTDPGIIGSKRERRVLSKTNKRAIFGSVFPAEDSGYRKIGVSLVTLKQPSSWHLDFFGEDYDETGEYKLKSLGKNKTAINIVLKEKWKNKDPSELPTVADREQHVNQIWTKYITALESEYNSNSNSPK